MRLVDQSLCLLVQSVCSDLVFLVLDSSTEETLYSQEHVSDKSDSSASGCAGDVSRSSKPGGAVMKC